MRSRQPTSASGAEEGVAPQVAPLKTAGIDRAISLLEREFELAAVHGRGVIDAQKHRDQRELRFNLGCGPNRKQGWVNIDLMREDSDLALDLREPWPFEPGCSSIVYAEHVFEHFDHPVDTTHFLSEALRVLHPGGRLSLAVPDTAWPLRAYDDPAADYWKIAKNNWHPSTCRTRIDHLNYHFRQDGEHRYAWDAETIIDLLSRCGFVHAHEREFDSLLDSAERKLGTLYVDAVKPSGQGHGGKKGSGTQPDVR